MPQNNDSGIRAFIALDLPAHGRQELLAVQKKLKGSISRGSIRWVGEKGFHLTLFFLGDGVKPEQTEALCVLLDQVSTQTAPFALSLGNLGVFPNPRRPQVLWAGLGGDLQSLTVLKERVDQGVVALGWAAERRPYHPHFTLGRVKDQMGVVNADLPLGQPAAEAAWTARAIHLYRSRLDRTQGAVYTKIHTGTFSL